ncbi:30S ribosomal protein S1 [Deinococcus misasensis]|uniref:30S ribosomal protein S1 n=1 Tax=Deinococcus misasensis TaxID=392413 RepID=UPI0005529444|nr:30S ribosomal protein S1 [Deinococcus misasensis]
MEDKATQTPVNETAQTTDTTREYPAMTMEDVLSTEVQYKEPQRGDVVNGTVVFISSEGIHVDVGAKVEGVIPFSQIHDEPITQEQAQELFKAGDQIEAYVVRVDLPNSTIVLSKRRADQDRGWRVLDNLFKDGKEFTVDILEKVRGGLVASIEGIRAFLPASQVDTRRVNDLSPYVGKPLEVKLIELNKKRNRVIISHRSIMEDRKAKAKADTLGKLESGAVLEGEVVEITDFGVFVSLGGLDGLVHRSELTHARFNHPKEVVKLGDKVQVQVIDLDGDRERINLSMKSLQNDPWQSAVEKYQIGERVSGKVTNLTNFGAFVELEPGLEGLIHVTEMSWTKRIRHPQEMVKVGDTVEAVVLRIDNKDRRISLGLRQTTEDPWSTLPDRLPPGTPVKGKITGITDFGVFMEIEEGIEGLIHISELSHDRVTNPAELFKRGDEIDAVILNIDPVEQRASLSRKRTIPYDGPARDYTKQGGGERGDRAMGTGGNRGGQGGGNRRKRDGFDYDYSYAKESTTSASSGKISTKLGDVYADLFAQFGIGGKKEEGKE